MISPAWFIYGPCCLCTLVAAFWRKENRLATVIATLIVAAMIYFQEAN